MEYYNVYELLYMYHCGSQAACRMMEEQMRLLMNKWIYEAVEANKNLLGKYVEELQQEALIGLYDAMDNYRRDKSTGFTTFLKVILDRRIQNFMRTIKDHPGQEVSLDEEIDNGKDTFALKDVVESEEDLSSPGYALRFSESYDALEDILSNMKAKERDILYVWINSESQQEAAQKMNMSTRMFGVRLSRTKLKMKEEYHKKTMK